MNLNNNIISTSINEVSTLPNSVNLKALTESNNIDNDSTSSFNVDLNLSPKRSDLSNTLKNFAQEISQGQSMAVKLEEQSTILSSIQNTTNKIITSEQPEITADEVQPIIQNHIQKYNGLTVDISQNIEKFQDATDSSTYFDGKLGAKPLSTSEILKAVEKQMTIINEQKDFTLKEMQKIETKALDTIGKEISKASASAPFKPIDFGKSIGNFSSANINNVLGSVAVSQANPIPANSPKLLA